LNKILNIDENSKSKEIWEKKWESFVSNNVKATKEIDNDDVLDSETTEEITPQVKETKEIKVQNFTDFINNRVKIKIEGEDDSVVENSVPKPQPTVKCTNCGVNVTDCESDMEGHLYSKHNFKPTVDDLDTWLLEYFPPKISEK
jgi:hypothetical protein